MQGKIEAISIIMGEDILFYFPSTKRNQNIFLVLKEREEYFHMKILLP